MRIWVDLSNSPHVELFGPILEHLERRGDEVVLTARDHAQTVALAVRRWPDVTVIGGPSPDGRAAKARTIGQRTLDLARFAAGRRLDVALSHGSYAQIAAASLIGLPAVTMMDYEYQPANHLSFRLARRVIVPRAFPDASLRRFGAEGKTLRYAGYKEEVYLAGFEPDPHVLDALGLSGSERVVAVLRPPPDGSLYHREQNLRFEEEARRVAERGDVTALLLARKSDRALWRRLVPGAIVPDVAVDGPSLVACADLTIGAGGTMNRESALLGTPTYTVFAGRLAAVDAELIRDGRLIDLRHRSRHALVAKKPQRTREGIPLVRRRIVLDVLDRALDEVSGARRTRPGVPAPERRRRPVPASRHG